MIREIWDHFAHPTIGVAGAGTTTLVGQSDANVPYDQFDIWIDSQYQWEFAGELTYYRYGELTQPIRKHIVISGQNGQPRAIRVSEPFPIQDIVCTGTYTNRNATNGVYITMHVNTVKFMRVK